MEVCSARLDPLQLWAGAHQMNVVRRSLYDVLEAQLGHTGLMLGGDFLATLNMLLATLNILLATKCLGYSCHA